MFRRQSPGPEGDLNGTFQWSLFLTALGIALVLEGLPYFLSPETVKKMAALLPQLPNSSLRLFGLLGMAAGVALVALSRLFL